MVGKKWSFWVMFLNTLWTYIPSQALFRIVQVSILTRSPLPYATTDKNPCHVIAWYVYTIHFEPQSGPDSLELMVNWTLTSIWFEPLWPLYTIWLVVWTPLKKWKSVGMMIPNIWKIKHFPNHQPAIILAYIGWLISCRALQACDIAICLALPASGGKGRNRSVAPDLGCDTKGISTHLDMSDQPVKFAGKLIRVCYQ